MSLRPKKLNEVFMNEFTNPLTLLTKMILDAKNGFFETINQITKDNKSIVRKSAPMIFQFPVLVTDSISMKSVTMIGKALEKQYAEFVRLASGLESVTSVKSVDDVKKLLTKLHVNISDNEILEKLSDSADIIDMNEVRKANSNLLREAGYLYTDQTIDEIYTYGAKYDFRKAIKINEDDQSSDPEVNVSGRIANSDIKKANNLEPTMLEISVLFAAKGKGDPTTVKINIGVKTVMHLVRNTEIIDNIVSAIFEKRFLFKFLKLTSGEISFFKDFFLNLDKNKKEAIDTAKNKTSVWWRALKNRAASSRARNYLKIFKQFPPNATLILSIEESDLLKNKYDIDILGKDVTKIRNIMQEYFLMSIVVVNEAAEVVHFFFDGNTEWEMHAFDDLKKESGNKELQKLISVMVGKA